MLEENGRELFWGSFIRALDAEPKEISEVKGASGLSHPIIAGGVDDSKGRIILISGDYDGRTAALAQADIQAAMPSHKIILARPISIDLPAVAGIISKMFKRTEFKIKDIRKLPDTFGPRIKRRLERNIQRITKDGIMPAIHGYEYARLNNVAAIQDVIMQLSHLKFEFAPDQQTEENDLSCIRFGDLIALDPSEIDRKKGICPIPLCDFSSTEAEVFHKGTDIDEARHILKRHNIFQYFFPAPDQLALALVGNSNLTASAALEQLKTAPLIGHPFGSSEIVPPNLNIRQTIEALQEMGLIIHGEVGLDLTNKGTDLRSVVRFTSQEGLLHKISRVLSVKVDLNLKDFFK